MPRRREKFSEPSRFIRSKKRGFIVGHLIPLTVDMRFEEGNCRLYYLYRDYTQSLFGVFSWLIVRIFKVQVPNENNGDGIALMKSVGF
jgi:hypothetical protein